MKERQATKSDFIVGNTLYDENGGWILKNKYDQGTFEARGERGEKIIFEGEFRFYKVKVF